MARSIDVQEIKDMNDDEGFFTKVKGSLRKPMVYLMATSAIVMSLGIQEANAIDIKELNHHEKMEEIYKACNYDNNGNAYVSDLKNPSLESMIKEKCEEAYDYKNSERAHSIGDELEMNAINDLNSGFTIEQQMAIMVVSSQLGGDPNNIHDSLSKFNDYHIDLVNNNEFDGSKNELLDLIIEDNGLTYNNMSQALSDEIISEIDSFFTPSSELKGEKRSLVVKNGMDVAKVKGMTDISEEKAIKLSQNNFLEIIDRDGGVWDDRIGDMSKEPTSLKNSYNSTIGYETKASNKFDNYKNDKNKVFDDFAKEKSAFFDDLTKEPSSLDVKQDTRSLDVKNSARKFNY